MYDLLSEIYNGKILGQDVVTNRWQSWVLGKVAWALTTRAVHEPFSDGRSYSTWNAMHLSKLLSFWYCMDKHHSTLLFVPLTGLRDWPVQPSNTLLMKNSMKSRECALVWHQVWSQSLCLYHNPINSVQLVWWELTYLVQVNIPNIKSFDEEFNPDFL